MRLNHKILNVALLRLRFYAIATSKPDPNLSVISAMLFPYRPKKRNSSKLLRISIILQQVRTDQKTQHHKSPSSGAFFHENKQLTRTNKFMHRKICHLRSNIVQPIAIHPYPNLHLTEYILAFSLSTKTTPSSFVPNFIVYWHGITSPLKHHSGLTVISNHKNKF